MARRIGAAAARAGISPERSDGISVAFLAMIGERSASVTDEHDPDFLHTGRTAVILLEDLNVGDADAAGAAVLFDSAHPELHGAALALGAPLGTGVVDVLHELSTPAADDAELIEALVLASGAARLVAVTEQLDHARHLHLRHADGWAAFHERFVRVFVPLAQRTHPRLAYRCERWSGAFAKRHLPM